MVWQKDKISGNGVPEAPIDGQAYARKNGGWQVVEGEVKEAPTDGKTYGRNNSAWVELQGFTPSAALEAKVDDLDAEVYSVYARHSFTSEGSTIVIPLREIGCKVGDEIHFECTTQSFALYRGSASGNVAQCTIVWDDTTHGHIDLSGTLSDYLRVYSLASGNTIVFTATELTQGLSEIREGATLSKSILYFNPETEFIPKLQQLKHNANNLVLAHFSDIHSTQRISLPRILRFTDHYADYIDDVLNTGDSVADYMNDGSFAFDSIEGAENVLNVIGNHDTASHVSGGGYDWTANVGSAAYAKYFAPFISNWGVVHDGNTSHCYYYKDYAEKGIRLIALDCMGYDSTQDAWFASTLAATPNGYSVIVAVHCFNNRIIVFDCNWSTFAYDRIIPAQSSYNPTMMAQMVTTLSTWINNGGNFICWLVGHSHFTFVGKIEDTNQIVVGVDTAQYGRATSNVDSLHVEGTRSMDSFQIESFDTTAKTITIVKVGCKNDKYGRIINSVCIDYQKGAIKADTQVSDGSIAVETKSAASTLSINADKLTVISGAVGTSTITLQVPNDNKAHVWDMMMSTDSSVDITFVMSNGATILKPSGFSIAASKDVEISIIGVGNKYYLRYGEFTSE
jgi:hypothetical protein